MRIVFLRSNPVSPDPRVEKEILTLCAEGYDVSVLAWDRSGGKDSAGFLSVGEYSVPIVRAGIESKFGVGLKNIKALFFFQMFLLKKLFFSRKEYDVIHAADFDTVLPAAVMRMLFNKKVVYDIYDFYVDAFSVPGLARKAVKWLDYNVIKYVDAVILTNESRVA